MKTRRVKIPRKTLTKRRNAPTNENHQRGLNKFENSVRDLIKFQILSSKTKKKTKKMNKQRKKQRKRANKEKKKKNEGFKILNYNNLRDEILASNCPRDPHVAHPEFFCALRTCDHCCYSLSLTCPIIGFSPPQFQGGPFLRFFYIFTTTFSTFLPFLPFYKRQKRIVPLELTSQTNPSFSPLLSASKDHAVCSFLLACTN